MVIFQPSNLPTIHPFQGFLNDRCVHRNRPFQVPRSPCWFTDKTKSTSCLGVTSTFASAPKKNPWHGGVDGQHKGFFKKPWDGPPGFGLRKNYECKAKWNGSPTNTNSQIFISKEVRRLMFTTIHLVLQKKLLGKKRHYLTSS